MRDIRPVINIIAPRKGFSIDQLISPETGFIAQHKGWLTQSWYTVVMVVVDHFSRLKLVFFQKMRISGEAYFRQNGCQEQHYYGNNGLFADNGWMTDATQRGQTISVWGLNAQTTKMAWPRKPLGTFKNKQEKAYCMPKLGGHSLFILHYSHMPCVLHVMQVTFFLFL